MGSFSTIFLAGTIFTVITSGVLSKVNIFDEFVKGVQEALKMMMNIFPSMLALFIAVGLLRSSGIIDLITFVIKPFSNFLGVPEEIIPLVLLRPISGSASLALVSDLFNNWGVDSIVGKTASVMMGSTETVFYVFAVYFGTIGVKNVRYALVVALLAEFVGVLLSCFVVRGGFM